MITEEKIKRDMMELWKETFHDSSRYIQLVFDTYFTPERIIVRYHENRIIASLLSVPYEFQILAKNGEKRLFRGLYLCGLATRQEFRRQGIMSEMMLEAERKARENGYDFTFLIPADSHLREYYRRKGYINSSFRSIERMKEKACLSYEHMHIYSIKNLYETGNHLLLECLADWCIEREKEDECPTIIHSRKDMMAVMAENENSIFLTEEAIDLEKSILAKVIAVAFPEFCKEEDGEERVVLAGLYVKNQQIRESSDTKEKNNICARIENKICKYYSGHKVELQKPYVNMHTYDMGVTPYAMLKPLDTNKKSCKIENIRYKIFLMLD